MPRSMTGGGVGTNQYAVRGVSQARQQGTAVLDDLSIDTIEDDWDENPEPRPLVPPEPEPAVRREWTVDGLGPIQAKRVQSAIRTLRREDKTHIELTGVIGDPESEHRSTYWVPMGGPSRDDVDQAEQELIRRFSPLTPANHRAAIAEIEAAAQAAALRRPVVDNRITAEEDAQRQALIAERNAAQNSEQRQRKEAWDAVTAKAPPGAQAVIIATQHEDTSDPMTDYFASRPVRSVAIGWRFSRRESFSDLRSAAASFEPTAALATQSAEHRDNYAWGGGNYLGQNPNYGSGWTIKSYPVSGRAPVSPPLEDHLPAPRAAAQHSTAGSTSTPRSAGGGVSVSPSSLGRAGVVEVRFGAKPSEDVRAKLKSAGFRWARSNSCWYGPESRLPSDLGE